jgi:hypothetical protein
MRGLLRQALLGLCLASPLAAQTSDPIFARWRWNPPSLGSRPGGLGGAFVAVADSVKAAYANPAGLTLIPVREIGLSSGTPWLGFATGSRTLRLAGYVTRIADSRTQWDDPGWPGSRSGFLESSVWEAGVAAGVQPLPRLRVGASLAWSRLDAEGEDTHSDVEGAGLSTSVAGNKGELRLAAGVLVDLVGGQRGSLPSLRLGVAYQPGFDWSADLRTALAGGTASVSIAVRRPSLIAAGLGYRPTDRWSFSAQGDIIRYSEVVATLRRNVGEAAADFSLPDTVEPRLGAEFASPLWCGCGVVKLRAGLHYASPGTLRYQGRDPVLARAFSSTQWRTVFSVGGSFFAEYLGNAVRLDVDSKDLFDGPALSFGIVWRF